MHSVYLYAIKSSNIDLLSAEQKLIIVGNKARNALKSSSIVLFSRTAMKALGLRPHSC